MVEMEEVEGGSNVKRWCARARAFPFSHGHPLKSNRGSCQVDQPANGQHVQPVRPEPRSHVPTFLFTVPRLRRLQLVTNLESLSVLCISPAI